MPTKIKLIALLVSLVINLVIAQNFTIARLKYQGGGDWYNDPDIIPNLAQELNRRTNIKTLVTEKVVSLTDEDLFRYPFLFITGHGNISFSDEEAKRLRTYLTTGGFLYADDDFGMDEAFRREIKKVFPENDFVELPYDHPIYNIIYKLNKLPQIHEHYENEPPRGYGLFYEGRLVIYYTWNSNISDGWTETYNDPPEKREQAFQMGINIIAYALAN
ncbi:MAG: DUF4159 domain-containing protein [candidate division WOR-3 bacterium]